LYGKIFGIFIQKRQLDFAQMPVMDKTSFSSHFERTFFMPSAVFCIWIDCDSIFDSLRSAHFLQGTIQRFKTRALLRKPFDFLSIFCLLFGRGKIIQRTLQLVRSKRERFFACKTFLRNAKRISVVQNIDIFRIERRNRRNRAEHLQIFSRKKDRPIHKRNFSIFKFHSDDFKDLARIKTCLDFPEWEKKHKNV